MMISKAHSPFAAARIRIGLGLAATLATTFAGCASAPSRLEANVATIPGPRDFAKLPSRIEISYLLGRNPRRFVAENRSEAPGAPTQATVQTYMEHTLVKEGAVDPDRYGEFMQKAVAFMDKCRRDVAGDASACRSPYTISLTTPGATAPRVVNGCRTVTGEGGPVGRLVHEGEFLLASARAVTPAAPAAPAAGPAVPATQVPAANPGATAPAAPAVPAPAAPGAQPPADRADPAVSAPATAGAPPAAAPVPAPAPAAGH